MLDLKIEVVQEMTQSAYHLYNRSTELINEQAKEVETDIKDLKSKLERIFASMPDVTPIEDEDVEFLEKIADHLSGEHQKLPNTPSDGNKDFENINHSLFMIEEKMKSIKKFEEWIDENKPDKSDDEELEPLLVRARATLYTRLMNIQEFEKALVRYKHVVTVACETLEVLIDKKIVAKAINLPAYSDDED